MKNTRVSMKIEALFFVFILFIRNICGRKHQSLSISPSFGTFCEKNKSFFNIIPYFLIKINYFPSWTPSSKSKVGLEVATWGHMGTGETEWGVR